MSHSFKKQNILVIGGLGFIGSHFVDKLLELDKNVTIFDNLSSGNTKWINVHIKNPRFRLIKGDLVTQSDLNIAVQGQDLVLYVGGNSDIPAGTVDTSLHLKNNILGMHNLLGAMRENSVKEIIFSSSSTVYGELPIKSENSGPLLPISLFGASKVACESLISAYCSLFGIRGWIFRLGNVVGDRMHRGVIHDFILKLSKDPSQLDVLGEGKQSRSFIFIDDVIEGMLYAYEHAELDESKPCDVFNISSSDTANMKGVIQAVLIAMNLNQVEIRYSGERRGWKGDLNNVSLNIEKIKKIGWTPKHNSQESLDIAAKKLFNSLQKNFRKTLEV